MGQKQNLAINDQIVWSAYKIQTDSDGTKRIFPNLSEDRRTRDFPLTSEKIDEILSVILTEDIEKWCDKDIENFCNRFGSLGLNTPVLNAFRNQLQLNPRHGLVPEEVAIFCTELKKVRRILELIQLKDDEENIFLLLQEKKELINSIEKEIDSFIVKTEKLGQDLEPYKKILLESSKIGEKSTDINEKVKVTLNNLVRASIVLQLDKGFTHVFPKIDFIEIDGKFEVIQTCSSFTLLGAIYIDLYNRFKNNTIYVRSCKCCGVIFHTANSKKTHCGDTCRNRKNTAIHRAREKGNA